MSYVRAILYSRPPHGGFNEFIRINYLYNYTGLISLQLTIGNTAALRNESPEIFRKPTTTNSSYNVTSALHESEFELHQFCQKLFIAWPKRQLRGGDTCDICWLVALPRWVSICTE
jgi:hypothetical protein